MLKLQLHVRQNILFLQRFLLIDSYHFSNHNNITFLYHLIAQNQSLHQGLTNADTQRIQDPSLETALPKPAEEDLAHVRAENARLLEENQSLRDQVGRLETDLQQAQDRVHIYEDLIN